MAEPTFRNGPDYRDLRSPDERVYVGAHVAHHPGDPPVFLMPARAMTLGKQSLANMPGVYHPSVTIFALQRPIGMIFLPTVEELEEVGGEMLRMAAAMRATAEAEATQAIERARKGGDGRA